MIAVNCAIACWYASYEYTVSNRLPLVRKTILTILGIISGLVVLIVVAVAGLVWYVMANGQPLTAAESAQLIAKGAKSQDASDYDVRKDKASQTALRLLPEDWFWSITDEDSPFGNDDGADALAHYRKWRRANQNSSPVTGVAEVCERLAVPFEQWKTTTHKAIAGDVWPSNFFATGPGDQMVIAIALGQLVDEGYVDSQLCQLGLQAVHNEQVPKMYERWVSPKERQERLAVMESVLLKAPTTAETKK
jgi:uncharacterized protein YfeS